MRAITRVSPIASPTSRADGKTLKASTKVRMNVVARPGASRGRITRRNRCCQLAPMVLAAASIEGPVPELERHRERRQDVEQRGRKRQPHRQVHRVEDEGVLEEGDVVREDAPPPLLLDGDGRLERQPDAVGERVDEQDDGEHQRRHEHQERGVDAPLRQPVPQAGRRPGRGAAHRRRSHVRTSSSSRSSTDSVDWSMRSARNTSTRFGSAVSSTTLPTSGAWSERTWRARPPGVRTPTANSRPWYSTTDTVAVVVLPPCTGTDGETTTRSSGRIAARTRSPTVAGRTAVPRSVNPLSSTVTRVPSTTVTSRSMRLR